MQLFSSVPIGLPRSVQGVNVFQFFDDGVNLLWKLSLYKDVNFIWRYVKPVYYPVPPRTPLPLLWYRMLWCCYIMQAKGKIQLVRREIDFSLENLSVSLNHRFILCQEDNQDGYFMIQLSSFQLTVRKTIREDCHGRFYRNFAGSSCICRPYSRVSNNRGYIINV